MEETKEEMKETIEIYGVDELLAQYVSDSDACDVLIEYVKSLEIQLQKIEYEINNSKMGTAIENIVKIIKG